MQALALPECVMLALYRELPRVRARRVLEAAQAASVPHLTKDGARRWWSAWERQASGRAPLSSGRPGEGVPLRRTSAFFWNGEPIRGRELRGRAREALGPGLSA